MRKCKLGIECTVNASLAKMATEEELVMEIQNLSCSPSYRAHLEVLFSEVSWSALLSFLSGHGTSPETAMIWFLLYADGKPGDGFARTKHVMMEFAGGKMWKSAMQKAGAHA